MEKITDINEELKLIQNHDGLTFGSDAYLLSAFVSGSSRLRGADLGSGTGVIPLLCASKAKASKIYAIEVQEGFVSLIERNAKLNSLSHIISPLLGDVREVKSAHTDGELDFVTANPPYMKVDSGKRNQFDEKFIARHEVMGGIGDFCACAYRLLKHGGRFYCVWRPDRLTDLIVSMRENRLEPKIMTFVCATKDSEPSIVLVRAIKGGSSGSAVTRNLILHGSKEDAAKSILSEDAKSIYENCSFEKFLK